jgi:hypothetical protein
MCVPFDYMSTFAFLLSVVACGTRLSICIKLSTESASCNRKSKHFLRLNCHGYPCLQYSFMLYIIAGGVFGVGWKLEGLSIGVLSGCNTTGHPRVYEGSWPLTERGWLVR